MDNIDNKYNPQLCKIFLAISDLIFFNLALWFSSAFEVMRDMVYNLPILTPPRWVRSRTTPIALENLLYYLVGLL
ncbi:hypothetical protein MJL30_39165, partial [Salmonella enterica subsp. enterica serovar Anatum]|nr:hypothetical protein [Salmonella enterica subsp. enterica serovar Anatum]